MNLLSNATKFTDTGSITVSLRRLSGGGLIFLHFAVFESSGVELAKRIGLAWGRGPEAPASEQTTSGFIVTSYLTPEGKNSNIFKGFPAKFDLHDELYWPLTGDQSEITVLATAQGPKGMGQADRYPQDGPLKPEEMDGKAWPVAWTKEVGEGKVFATILGHNFFAFNDPYFRIMLFRAMAWTMGEESWDAFKPLVNIHLEN